MVEIKIRKVGNSFGVVLPREALLKMQLGEGDTLYLTDAPDGSFRMTPSNPEFAQQMEAAGSIIKRYRNTLRELAK